MINGILILHIVITVALIGLVLIQKSEGGALGMGGGGAGGGFMTTRGTANLLTRTTAVMAVLFFVTTLALAILFKGESKPKSILEDVIPVAGKPSEASKAEPMSKPLESPQQVPGQTAPKKAPTVAKESSKPLTPEKKS